jgi:hypothetical protein
MNPGSTKVDARLAQFVLPNISNQSGRLTMERSIYVSAANDNGRRDLSWLVARHPWWTALATFAASVPAGMVLFGALKHLLGT